MPWLIVCNGTAVSVSPVKFDICAGLDWVDAGTSGAGIGWTYASGTWTAPVLPVIPPPTFAQQVAAAMAAGVTVTSTGTPALNGTYTIDAEAQLNINSTLAYIALHGTFFLGSAVYPWSDTAGALHVFPTTAAFQAFATAVGDYTATLFMAGLRGAGPLPSPSVTIA